MDQNLDCCLEQNLDHNSQLDQDLEQDLVEVSGWDMDQNLDHCLDQTFHGAIEKFDTDHLIQPVG